MSVLRKPYELSIWGDTWNSDTGRFDEEKLVVIGSNTMTSQSRALSPKLVENVNGTHTLSFMIYYQYKDNITGEDIENPYAPYLTNERKLKLNYDGKWYNFIIKSVKEDSSKHSYEISAIDQYINELSKNGFNLTLDAELNNNVGSVQSLAQKSLEATDWVVPDAMVDGSEFIPDKANETLVKLKVTQSFIAAHILDGDDITPGTAPDDSHTTTITANTIIYAFYSCLMDEAPRFQFICGAEPFTKNDERVITTSSCQYYAINDMTYSTPVLGMPIPTVCSNDISDVVISDDYRGARYIFSPNTQYNTILGRYVSIYTKDGVEYYGYSTTDFKAPNLIQNWVTNPNTFKSTSGWHAGTTSSGATSSARGEIKNIAVRNTDSSRKLIDDLESGDFQSWVAEENHHYIPKLDYTAPATLTNLGVIINTGFYDNRTAIKNLINGQKFMCRIKGSNTLANKSIALRLGTVDNERYTLTTYLTDSSITIPSSLDSEGYYVVQLTIQNSEFTEKEYKKQDNGRVYIVINGSAAVQIEDFQIFEKVDTDEGYMRPEDQLVEAKVVTTYYLYDKEAVDNLDAASAIEDLNPAYKSTIDPRLSYDLPLSCEKRRAISVKESNYFNVIQTLCETFECWADFIIGHDADGAITSKQIVFKNYIGSQNWAGFRYGVNLKSVSRTDDSKAIVTKLVVKQNSNEFGTNGFCTIARAPSNESGENHIYNVDYYINQGLLSIDDWNDYVYGSNGYFTQLRILNLDLKGKNEIAIKQAIVLAQAQADLTTAEAGYAAVIDQYEEACAAFRKLCGYDYDNPDWTQIPSVRALVTDSKNIKYLTNCGEYYQARYDFNQKKVLAKARYNDLKLEYDYLYKDQASLNPDPDRVHFDGINELNRKKELLHKAFYEKFYRFIQEGTWNNEEYYDDEKYYLDALSTLYTSSVPKVSYNISVLELSQLQGYTDFTFAVGDRTYVEDPEFFGYDDNGAPIREEVVLSEITYNLDEPDKNSIKVQNFKTQFQDLFKKIAATVQSVQFSTGAYNKAAQLADANDTKKSSYLQGALNDASTILQNLAEQTVRLDSEGLTITDGAESNRKLRAVSGGILLTEDGGNTWDVGITASGVSAKILTTGTLNTGVVNIMYGDEPTFRWDAFGITAYDFANNNPMLPILDTGVRFDRLGVYGFTGAPGDWHPDHVVTWETSTDTHEPPKAANGIREHSIFEVTKEGLYLDIGKGRSTYGHGRTRTVTTNNDVTTVDYTYDAITQVIHNTIASLGKVEDVVYNKWDNSNPYYTLTEQNTVNPFVKVMSVGYKVPGTDQESENFALYDDGTVRARKILVREGIGYDDGSGLVKIAYGVNSTLPADGTTWSGLDNTTGNWHKVRQANDNYIATTYDNGAHWFGPTHIADKEIVSTTQEYLITNSGVTPLDNDPNWSATMPSTAGQFGKVLWVKIIAQRADGTSFVLQKLPLAIPEEMSDFNISADHNVIIVDKKQNLNTSTVVCTATSGWDTYTWTVPAGVTYNAVANILTLSLDYGTVIAHQSITITCQGEKNGYTSAIDNVTIATVFDGTDGWTIINTNPTFTYTADFTGHAKTTTPANPQTETTTIEVYHGGTKIGNYDAGHSDTTKYYFKVASISNTNYLEFSRTNNASSCVISGSIVSGNPSVADNSIELSITIYKGSELQSDLTKNTRLSWVFVYDGAPGPEGASGVSPYTMELTNDSIQIGADYDGSGAVFGGQVIGIQVSQGTTLQSSWGITAAQCYYVDGTLITPQPAIVSSVTGTQTEVTLISGAAWPTAVTTDSFILRITASNGTLTLIKDATIKRLYNGQPGTWYHLQCEITTLPRLTKNPSTFGITTFKVAGYKYVGNVKSSASDKYIAYTINSGITWTRVNEAGSKTFSTSSLNLSDSTTNIGFALIEADGVVNYSLDPAKTLDGPEFISVVDNGENGDPGEHGTDSDTQFIYMRRASTSPIPDPKTDVWVTATANSATEGTAGTWYITNLDAVSSYRRVYRAQQTKTVTYVNNVPQTPTITCTQPEVYKAWHDDETGAAHVDQIAYATFIRTTNNGKTDALYFSDGTDGATAGRLYINATYIKTGALDAGLITTGTLMVTDGTNTVFSANVNSGAVQIGGFQVDYNALWYTGSTTNTAFTYSKFFICSEGTSTNWTVGGSGSTNGWVLLVRNGNSGSGVFGIKNTGAMYATSGEIGTWSIGPTSLYTSSGSYVYLSGGGNFTANKKSPIAQAMNQYDASSTTTVVSDLCMCIGSDASNAVFGIGTDGKIYATAGYLGGWQVDPAGLYAAAKDIIENEQWEYFKTYSHLQPGTGLWKLNLTTVEKNTLQTYFGITTNSTLYTGVSDFAPALGTLAIFTGSEQAPDAFMSRNYITALAHILCRYAQSSFARQTTENANGCRIYSSQTTSMGNLQYGIAGGTVIDVLGNVNIVNRIISCRGSSSDSSSTGIRFCTNGEGKTGGDNNRPTYSIMCSGFRRAGRTSGSHDAVSWSQFWSQIDNWASDRNKKQNITALANLPAYDLLFDALQPCRYQYKNGNSGRYHTGFIAQDIVQSLTDVGLTMQDLAAVCYDDTDPEDSYWFLRRDELIALNIDQTQRLKTRVSQLESRVHELEALLNEN